MFDKLNLVKGDISMPNSLSCPNCRSQNVVPFPNSEYLQCKNCGRTFDGRGLKPYIAKAAGTALGLGVSVLTLGLLPDEVQDGIGDFFSDLFS